MHIKKIVVLLTFLLQGAYAKEGDQIKGREIALKSEEAADGYIGEKSNMEMLITNARGETINRKMQGLGIEVKDGNSRRLMIFESPNDIKGTKLLTWANKKEEDDQWLYLPSLKRVKRIAASGRSSSFMGSEFSFEDLGSQSISKYDYYFLKEEQLEGEKTWVLDCYPKVESSYSKQRLWMSMKYLAPIKIDYYNARDELIKTATFKDYKAFKVGSKTIYRAQSVTMNNLQNQKSSEFSWGQLELGAKLNENDFQSNELGK